MLSPKAAILLGAASLLLVSAVAFHRPGLAVLGAGTFLLFAVNALFATPPRLEARVRASTERASEGQLVRAEISVTNASRRTALFEHRLEIPRTFSAEGPGGTGRTAIPGHRDRTWSAGFRPHLFGAEPLGPLKVRVADPSALRHAEFVVARPASLLVLPRIEPLKSAPLKLHKQSSFHGLNEVSQPGDGFEFFTLRKYQHGDSMRSINWRASARASEMIVNQRQRESFLTAHVVIDATRQSLTGRSIVSPYAVTARAAASLTEHLIHRRDRVHFHVMTDRLRTIEPATPERQKATILETLATLEPHGFVPWEQVLKELLPKLRQGSPVVFASSFEADPTVVPVLRDLASREHTVLGLSAATVPIGDEDADELELRRLHRAMVRSEFQATGGLFVDVQHGRPLATAFLEATLQ